MIKWVVFAAALSGLGVVLLIGRKQHHGGHFFWRRLVVAWGLLLVTIIVAMLPIAVQTVTSSASNTDILFVVDRTASMNAADGRSGNDSTRLQDVRTDMHTIADHYAGASIGIMAFSDQVSAYLPLTAGSADISTAIDTIYTTGEFETIQKVTPFNEVFKQVSDYIGRQQQLDPTRQRVVVFMSDFEIYNNQEQSDQIVTASQPIKAHGASFLGVLYGQDGGAKILNMLYDYEASQFVPAYTKYGDEDYIKYLRAKGGPVTSVPNVDLSAKLSAQFGTPALRANQSPAFAPAIDKAITQSGRQVAKNPQAQALNQNIVYVLPALLLFVWLCASELLRPSWLRLLQPKRPPTRPEVRP